jgi:septum site-determining protein MinC
MPETETIQVVGRGTNVNFSIDDSVPFEVAERRLREYLSECRSLYSSGRVTVNVGRRILSAGQMAAIRGILGQETGLTVTSYWCPPEVLSKALAGPEFRLALPSPSVEMEEGQLDDPIDAEAFPTNDTPDGCQGEIMARLPLPDLPGQTAKPEGKQLAMAFPDLDGGPAARNAMPGTGAKRARPKDTRRQFVSTVTKEGTNSASAAISTRAGILVNDDREEAAGAGPVGEIPVADTEVGGDATPSLVQNPLPRGGEALIIKHTCRSGEVIRYPGDVVVFGDVNPGAEIVAAGDIVVLGALRGMAHAGAEGNLKSTIFALNLESHRLQISSCVGERPREFKKDRGIGKGVNPQIAYLLRRSIFVAPFERRCEEYRGGVPYEG